MIKRHSRIQVTNVPLIHKDYMPIIRLMGDAWDLKSCVLLNKSKFFVARHERLGGYTTTVEVTQSV